MLKTLVIHGYRGFESYTLNDLARVNLIVGKNNCGKTSILEATQLLVSGGNPRIFSSVARRRNEISTRYSKRVSESAMDFSHVFFGHTLNQGTCFRLTSNDVARALTVKILGLDEVEEDGELAYLWDVKLRQLSAQSEQDERAVPYFALSIESGEAEKRTLLPVLENGFILFNRFSTRAREQIFRAPVHFLTLDSFDPSDLGEMWDAVLSEGREAEIVDDMKVLEPSLASIHFLTGGRSRSGVLLGFQDSGRRVPIGSYGDGMRRLLALRLSFAGTANGFLLVDEIDTGLHWTVMEEMWQFVVQVARKSNAQVLATTHSYDCIRGLAGLVQSQPDLMDQVCIQKVDTSLKQAVCLRGEQIKVAVEQDIEVR